MDRSARVGSGPAGSSAGLAGPAPLLVSRSFRELLHSTKRPNAGPSGTGPSATGPWTKGPAGQKWVGRSVVCSSPIQVVERGPGQVAAAVRRSRSESPEDRPEQSPGPSGIGDLLDPLMRALAHPVRPNCPVTEATALPQHVLPSDLADLLTKLARKVAWGGDGRRATARVELGVGPLAGATLVVSTEGRAVELLLELPPGVSATSWQERLTARLAERGLEVARVEVR